MADGREGGAGAERDRRVGGGLRSRSVRGKRGPLITRRRLLTTLGLGGAALLGGRIALPYALAVPEPTTLPPDLADWVAGLFEGIDRARMWDVHCHVFGNGSSGSGCRVNRRVRSALQLHENLQYDVFLAASGTDDGDGVDTDALYINRLRVLHDLAGRAGRRILLAFDHFHHEDGRVDPSVMPFHTPNRYVLDLARNSLIFEAGVSIHPYRDDAVEELNACHADGARLVKWLPACMGMDPASPLCDPFYERLAALGMPLLVHCGSEHAVGGAKLHELGNPLRLRRALEAGVRVIVAHCASTGDDLDLDAPAGRRTRVPSFDLFLRLMADPRYERSLAGDISAITQVNRCGRPLQTLLVTDALHHRLLDGSDYPLPAIDPLISTWVLARRGYLTADQRARCNRVFAHNPLLFDFVVKRCLQVEDGGRRARFAPTVFETSWMFT